MFTQKFLRGWQRKAMRHKILFSALDHSDRGYLYLVIRGFDEIRDAEVGKIIVKILAKLKEALKNPFVKAVETEGYQKAEKLAAQAVEWGYAKAKIWALDHGFSRYLTFLDFTKPKGWVV